MLTGGYKHVKDALIETLEYPIKYPHVFKRLGLTPASGLLLYGVCFFNKFSSLFSSFIFRLSVFFFVQPPGCGKTLLAKAIGSFIHSFVRVFVYSLFVVVFSRSLCAPPIRSYFSVLVLATECQANFLECSATDILSSYVGESEKHVRELFAKARQASPCIVFFDNIDSVASKRATRSNRKSVYVSLFVVLLYDVSLRLTIFLSFLFFSSCLFSHYSVRIKGVRTALIES
jgi:transitional endoplasmic reticulum ATPase